MNYNKIYMILAIICTITIICTCAFIINNINTHEPTTNNTTNNNNNSTLNNTINNTTISEDNQENTNNGNDGNSEDNNNNNNGESGESYEEQGYHYSPQTGGYIKYTDNGAVDPDGKVVIPNSMR